ncbi:hypothetical protein [uncultured Enterovirga sp.]|uniref:hypothetical protein n=1 Tax=uncultured Enterovirga sp. TaxID=2026352 RepID=UPI0035CCA140
MYLLEEDGVLRKVPRRVCDGLVHGNDALPAYAGTRQRMVGLVVENVNGKPVRILDAEGSYWSFDQAGKIDHDLHRQAAIALSYAFGERKEPASEGKVVDLRPDFKKKQWQSQNKWNVTAEILDRITADLWPGSAQAEQLLSVKGSSAKRPPLTYEARSAVSELGSKIGSIVIELEALSETALKGLIFEARETAAQEAEHRPLWEGVATQADRIREIKARRRTGTGIWFAVLRVWHQVSDREMREMDTVEVRCKGREAAAEAAQNLLRENAHRFSENVTIQAELLSDLEWQTIDDRSELHRVEPLPGLGAEPAAVAKARAKQK